MAQTRAEIQSRLDILNEAAARPQGQASSSSSSASTSSKKSALLRQETLDEVVKENMEELGMDLAAALEDAIKQFSLVMGQSSPQPESLDHLVLDPAAWQRSAEIEELVSGLQVTLKPVAEADSSRGTVKEISDETAVNKALVSLRKALATENDKTRTDFAKIMARNGGFGAVLFACTRFPDSEELICSGFSLVSELLRNGSTQGLPRSEILIPDQGISLICDTLKRHSKSKEVLSSGYRLVISLCAKSEETKERFHRYDFKTLVQEHIQNIKEKQGDELLKLLCRVIVAYLSDDDMREGIHPNVFARARELGEDVEPLQTLLQYLETTATEVGSPVLRALASIAVNDLICQRIAERNGIKLGLKMLKLMASKPSQDRGAAIAFLKAIARNDTNKRAIALDDNETGLREIYQCLTIQDSEDDGGLSLLTVLTLRQPDIAYKMVSLGFVPLLLNLLPSRGARDCRQCLFTIRNMVSDVKCQPIRAEFLQNGAEKSIREVRAKHSLVCEEAAYAALRDLGLDLESIRKV